MSRWLPMLTWLDCITQPSKVAREVRHMCARHERQMYDLELANERLRRELVLAAAQLEAARESAVFLWTPDGEAN